MNDLVKGILPVIANALLPGAGALVGIAEAWLGNKLGVPADQVKQTLAGYSPAELIKIKELDNEFAKHMADNGIALDLANISTNTEQAKHDSIFVAGARPFVMWIGGVSLSYATIIDPFARFVAQVGFGYTGQFPVVDTTLTMAVLAGTLGISALRSMDKKNGV